MEKSEVEVEQVKQTIIEMVYKFRPDIKLSFSEEVSSKQGFFQPYSRDIKLFTDSIHKHAIKNNWEVIDTFIIVAAHELGHASDDDLVSLLGEQERLKKRVMIFREC